MRRTAIIRIHHFIRWTVSLADHIMPVKFGDLVLIFDGFLTFLHKSIHD